MKKTIAKWNKKNSTIKQQKYQRSNQTDIKNKKTFNYQNSNIEQIYNETDMKNSHTLPMNQSDSKLIGLRMKSEEKEQKNDKFLDLSRV